jgi:hypothetical protein
MRDFISLSPSMGLLLASLSGLAVEVYKNKKVKEVLFFGLAPGVPYSVDGIGPSSKSSKVLYSSSIVRISRLLKHVVDLYEGW